MRFDARSFEGQPLQLLLARVRAGDIDRILGEARRQMAPRPRGVVRTRGAADQPTVDLMPAMEGAAVVDSPLPPDHPPVQIPRVTLVEWIGAGAEGIVYLGIAEQTGRNVAVKLVRQDAGATRSSAVREALICAKLQHPNIVRVLTVELLPPWWVIIMELVKGCTLSTAAVSQRDKPVFGQLSDALCLLSARGIVHRDVKPANVILRDANRSPVLIDFGLAVDLGAAEWMPDSTQGTPIFMAPDALRGNKPEPSWDWYSLGITVAEVLLGMRFCGKYSSLTYTDLAALKLTGAFDREVRQALRELEDAELSSWCAALTDSGSPEREKAIRQACHWQ